MDSTRHVRIVYHAITKTSDWSDTTGATATHGSYWTLWMDIVYKYSVYQSSDFNAISADVAQFPNNQQPILAYISPQNRPPPAGSVPPASGVGGGGGGGGHSHIFMVEFPSGRSPAGLQQFAESALDKWIAKTEELDKRLQAATQGGTDDGADGKGKGNNTEC
ncbi:hypothetical protein QFC19_000425 [Naganishia cerealis]|uniref:Uncharacterized protein n=1 Tax=Naganishia cerealis TaxID=610337 RepID=A0ACC2WM98_9TREE|nr:hypothetical protein QFC19_000425 [Naganishia cerealis]